MKITIDAPETHIERAMQVAQSYIIKYGDEDRPRLRNCVSYSPRDLRDLSYSMAVWGNRDHVRVRVVMCGA